MAAALHAYRCVLQSRNPPCELALCRVSFLPFSLWDAAHWVTIPASGVIAFLLLGIEEIGVQIEEPFGILPLGAPLDSPAMQFSNNVGWSQADGRHRLYLTGMVCHAKTIMQLVTWQENVGVPIYVMDCLCVL